MRFKVISYSIKIKTVRESDRWFVIMYENTDLVGVKKISAATLVGLSGARPE